MKKFWIALPIAISALTFTSCKKDKNDDGNTQTVYTAEQNKTNLQNTGISLVQDMGDMKNLESMHAIESFNACVNQADPFGGSSNYPLMVMGGIELAAKTNSIKPIKQTLKAGNSNTLFSNYADVVGTYTWTNGAWVKTSSNNNVVFVFPATKNGTTNNATFTLSATEYTGTYLDPSMEGNTPSAISADLTVSGKGSILGFDFSSTINTSGEPTKIDAAINFTPFKFSYEFNNSGSKISKTFKFDKSTSNLATFYVEANGTFNKTAIENFINEEDFSKLNTVVTTASGYVKIKDIKLALSANVADGINYYNSIGNANFDENDAITMLNNNTSIKLTYASSDQTIATGEWYLMTNTYTDYQWDDNAQNWVEVQNTSNEPSVRIVFPDGSKSDLETYFGNGFDDLQNDIEQFFNDIETAYDM